jgi:hypothetical protein
MITYTSRPQRISDITTPIVGVFEDDGLLLRLAARSHGLESACRHPSRDVALDDLILEGECPGWSAGWDL